MKKLEILEINNHTYTLKDSKEEKYKLILEFHDIKDLPSIGNFIYVDESLIKNMNFYAFGTLNSQYGKIIQNEDNIDILILEKEDKKYYFKRLYG